MEIKKFFKKEEDRIDEFTMGFKNPFLDVVDVITIKAINGIVSEIHEWTVQEYWAAEIAEFSVRKGAKLPDVMTKLRSMGFSEYDFDKKSYGIF